MDHEELRVGVRGVPAQGFDRNVADASEDPVKLVRQQRLVNLLAPLLGLKDEGELVVGRLDHLWVGVATSRAHDVDRVEQRCGDGQTFLSRAPHDPFVARRVEHERRTERAEHSEPAANVPYRNWRRDRERKLDVSGVSGALLPVIPTGATDVAHVGSAHIGVEESVRHRVLPDEELRALDPRARLNQTIFVRLDPEMNRLGFAVGGHGRNR